MSNILIISAVFPPEPVVSAQISHDIATELSRSNNVTVLCPRPTRPSGFNFENKTRQSQYRRIVLDSFTCPKSTLFNRLRESISFGWESGKFIADNHKEIDIIYMNAWPLFAQFIILRKALKFKINVITHVQDIYPESYTNKLSSPLKHLLHLSLLWIDKYTLRNCDQIIAISDRMSKYLIKSRILQPSKVTIVPNWQDENDFINFHKKKMNNPISEKQVFMYLGNIGPVAGVEFLIKCFVRADLLNTKLVVAGSGSMKEHCQKLRLNYPDSDIEFWDVPFGKVPEIQSYANVMLLPIKKGAASSSIPSKLMAYMLSKKPIIACLDIESDTADAILKSGCGWVIEPEKEDLLIELFKTVNAESNASSVKKGEMGYSYAIELFSKKTNLKKITELILSSC